MSEPVSSLTLRVMVERDVSWGSSVPPPDFQAHVMQVHERDLRRSFIGTGWKIAEGRGLTDESLAVVARALHSYSLSQRRLAEKRRHVPPMEPAEREWLLDEAETAGALAYELDARLKGGS